MVAGASGFVLASCKGVGSSSRYEIRSSNMSIRISGHGELTGIRMCQEKQWRPVTARTVIGDCEPEGKATLKLLSDGSLEVNRTLVRKEDHRSVLLKETFRPTEDSIRWEINLTDDGSPWSAPIQTILHYPIDNGAQFWAPWGDPRYPQVANLADPGLTGHLRYPEGNDWMNPLEPVPFLNGKLYYGSPYYKFEQPRNCTCPFRADLLCIPMASIIDGDSDTGLTMALSIEDLLLNLTLDTFADGTLCFSRLHHRLGEGRTVGFALDLTAHEADWRPGLHWVTRRYPAYFEPSDPGVFELAGTGAYSCHDVEFDRSKMEAMAFRTNWRASFDFPYMGMFLPPVTGVDEAWKRHGGGMMTLRRMDDYCKKMRKAGFYVLSYFNVTEYGVRMNVKNTPPRKATSEEDLWKDPHDFLFGKLRGLEATLRIPEGEAVYDTGYGHLGEGWPHLTWDGAIAMDPGEPVYRDFLLDQARRHIDHLPESSGICIDRMDWIRLFNFQRDDGLSWVEGRPARAMHVSWLVLMEQMGPTIHEAGKYIFVNNHTKRIDLLEHVDGIFDEFTYLAAPLNTTALLCVNKPALGWSSSDEDLQPDPDAYLQKFLYMGIYPMAPFPGNDHSLRPGPLADQCAAVRAGATGLLRTRRLWHRIL